MRDILSLFLVKIRDLKNFLLMVSLNKFFFITSNVRNQRCRWKHQITYKTQSEHGIKLICRFMLKAQLAVDLKIVNSPRSVFYGIFFSLTYEPWYFFALIDVLLYIIVPTVFIIKFVEYIFDCFITSQVFHYTHFFFSMLLHFLLSPISANANSDDILLLKDPGPADLDLLKKNVLKVYTLLNISYNNIIVVENWAYQEDSEFFNVYTRRQFIFLNRSMVHRSLPLYDLVSGSLFGGYVESFIVEDDYVISFYEESWRLMGWGYYWGFEVPYFDFTEQLGIVAIQVEIGRYFESLIDKTLEEEPDVMLQQQFDLLFIYCFFMFFYLMPWLAKLDSNKTRKSRLKITSRFMLPQYEEFKFRLNNLRDEFLLSLIKDYYITYKGKESFDDFVRNTKKNLFNQRWSGIRRKNTLLEFRRYESAKMYERLVRANSIIYLEESLRKAFYEPIYYSAPDVFNTAQKLRKGADSFLKNRFYPEFGNGLLRRTSVAYANRFLTAPREHPVIIQAKRLVGAYDLEKSFFLEKYKNRILAQRQIIHLLIRKRNTERRYRLAVHRLKKKKSFFARRSKNHFYGVKQLPFDFFFKPWRFVNRLKAHLYDPWDKLGFYYPHKVRQASGRVAKKLKKRAFKQSSQAQKFGKSIMPQTAFELIAMEYFSPDSFGAVVIPKRNFFLSDLNSLFFNKFVIPNDTRNSLEIDPNIFFFDVYKNNSLLGEFPKINNAHFINFPSFLKINFNYKFHEFGKTFKIITLIKFRNKKYLRILLPRWFYRNNKVNRLFFKQYRDYFGRFTIPTQRSKRLFFKTFHNELNRAVIYDQSTTHGIRERMRYFGRFIGKRKMSRPEYNLPEAGLGSENEMLINFLVLPNYTPRDMKFFPYPPGSHYFSNNKKKKRKRGDVKKNNDEDSNTSYRFWCIQPLHGSFDELTVNNDISYEKAFLYFNNSSTLVYLLGRRYPFNNTLFKENEFLSNNKLPLSVVLTRIDILRKYQLPNWLNSDRLAYEFLNFNYRRNPYSAFYTYSNTPTIIVDGQSFPFLNFLNWNYGPLLKRVSRADSTIDFSVSTFFGNPLGISSSDYYILSILPRLLRRSRRFHKRRVRKIAEKSVHQHFFANEPKDYNQLKDRHRRYFERFNTLKRIKRGHARRRYYPKKDFYRIKNKHFLKNYQQKFTLAKSSYRRHVLLSLRRIYKSVAFRPVYRGLRWKRRYSLRQWRLLKLTKKKFTHPLLLRQLNSLYRQYPDYLLFSNSLQKWGHRYGYYHFDFTGMAYEPSTNLFFLSRHLKPFLLKYNKNVKVYSNRISTPINETLFSKILSYFNLFNKRIFLGFEPFDLNSNPMNLRKKLIYTRLSKNNLRYLIEEEYIRRGLEKKMRDSSSVTGAILTDDDWEKYVETHFPSEDAFADKLIFNARQITRALIPNQFLFSYWWRRRYDRIPPMNFTQYHQIVGKFHARNKLYAQYLLSKIKARIYNKYVKARKLNSYDIRFLDKNFRRMRHYLNKKHKLRQDCLRNFLLTEKEASERLNVIGRLDLTDFPPALLRGFYAVVTAMKDDPDYISVDGSLAATDNHVRYLLTKYEKMWKNYLPELFTETADFYGNSDASKYLKTYSPVRSLILPLFKDLMARSYLRELLIILPTASTSYSPVSYYPSTFLSMYTPYLVNSYYLAEFSEDRVNRDLFITPYNYYTFAYDSLLMKLAAGNAHSGFSIMEPIIDLNAIILNKHLSYSYNKLFHRIDKLQQLTKLPRAYMPNNLGDVHSLHAINMTNEQAFFSLWRNNNHPALAKWIRRTRHEQSVFNQMYKLKKYYYHRHYLTQLNNEHLRRFFLSKLFTPEEYLNKYFPYIARQVHIIEENFKQPFVQGIPNLVHTPLTTIGFDFYTYDLPRVFTKKKLAIHAKPFLKYKSLPMLIGFFKKYYYHPDYLYNFVQNFPFTRADATYLNMFSPKNILTIGYHSKSFFPELHSLIFLSNRHLMRKLTHLSFLSGYKDEVLKTLAAEPYVNKTMFKRQEIFQLVQDPITDPHHFAFFFFQHYHNLNLFMLFGPHVKNKKSNLISFYLKRQPLMSFTIIPPDLNSSPRIRYLNEKIFFGNSSLNATPTNFSLNEIKHFPNFVYYANRPLSGWEQVNDAYLRTLNMANHFIVKKPRFNEALSDFIYYLHLSRNLTNLHLSMPFSFRVLTDLYLNKLSRSTEHYFPSFPVNGFTEFKKDVIDLEKIFYHRVEPYKLSTTNNFKINLDNIYDLANYYDYTQHPYFNSLPFDNYYFSSYNKNVKILPILGFIERYKQFDARNSLRKHYFYRQLRNERLRIFKLRRLNISKYFNFLFNEKYYLDFNKNDFNWHSSLVSSPYQFRHDRKRILRDADKKNYYQYSKMRFFRRFKKRKFTIRRRHKKIFMLSPRYRFNKEFYKIILRLKLDYPSFDILHHYYYLVKAFIKNDEKIRRLGFYKPNRSFYQRYPSIAWPRTYRSKLDQHLTKFKYYPRHTLLVVPKPSFFERFNNFYKYGENPIWISKKNKKFMAITPLPNILSIDDLIHWRNFKFKGWFNRRNFLLNNNLFAVHYKNSFPRFTNIYDKLLDWQLNDVRISKNLLNSIFCDLAFKSLFSDRAFSKAYPMFQFLIRNAQTNFFKDLLVSDWNNFVLPRLLLDSHPIKDSDEINFEPFWHTNFYKLREFRPSDTRRFWPHDLSSHKRILRRLANYTVYAPVDGDTFNNKLMLEQQYAANKQKYDTLKKVFLIKDYNEFNLVFTKMILKDHKLTKRLRSELYQLFAGLTPEKFYLQRGYFYALCEMALKILHNHLLNVSRSKFKNELADVVSTRLLDQYLGNTNTNYASILKNSVNFLTAFKSYDSPKNVLDDRQLVFVARRLAYQQTVNFLTPIVDFFFRQNMISKWEQAGLTMLIKDFANSIAANPRTLAFPSYEYGNKMLNKIFKSKFLQYYGQNYKKLKMQELRLSFLHKNLDFTTDFLPESWSPSWYSNFGYSYLRERFKIINVDKILKFGIPIDFSPHLFARPVSEIFYDTTPSANFDILNYLNFNKIFEQAILQNDKNYDVQQDRVQVLTDLLHSYLANDDIGSANLVYSQLKKLNQRKIQKLSNNFLDSKVDFRNYLKQLVMHYYYQQPVTIKNSNTIFMPVLIPSSLVRNNPNFFKFFEMFNQELLYFMHNARRLNFIDNLEDRRLLHRLHMLSTMYNKTANPYSNYQLFNYLNFRYLTYKYSQRTISDIFWQLRHFTRYPYPQRQITNFFLPRKHSKYFVNPIYENYPLLAYLNQELSQFSNSYGLFNLSSFLTDLRNVFPKYFFRKFEYTKRYDHFKVPIDPVPLPTYVYPQFIKKVNNFFDAVKQQMFFDMRDFFESRRSQYSSSKLLTKNNYHPFLFTIYPVDYEKWLFDILSPLGNNNSLLPYTKFQTYSDVRALYPIPISRIRFKRFYYLKQRPYYSNFFDHHTLFNFANNQLLAKLPKTLVYHTFIHNRPLLTFDEIQHMSLVEREIKKLIVFYKHKNLDFESNVIHQEPLFQKYLFTGNNPVILNRLSKSDSNYEKLKYQQTLFEQAFKKVKFIKNYKNFDKLNKNYYYRRPYRLPLKYSDVASRRAAFFKNHWKPGNKRLRKLISRRRKLLYKPFNGFGPRPYHWPWLDEIRSMVGLVTPRYLRRLDLRPVRQLTSHELEQIGLNYLLDYYPYIRLWYYSTESREYQNLMSYYTNDPDLQIIHYYELPIQYCDNSELPFLSFYSFYDRDCYAINPFWSSVNGHYMPFIDYFYAYAGLITIIIMLNSIYSHMFFWHRLVPKIIFMLRFYANRLVTFFSKLISFSKKKIYSLDFWKNLLINRFHKIVIKYNTIKNNIFEITNFPNKLKKKISFSIAEFKKFIKGLYE